MEQFKKKYYVVWKGIAPGVYDSWAECKLQVETFPGASYKSFPSLEAALQAFRGEAPERWKPQPGKVPAPQQNPGSTSGPVYPSISVDAACSGNPGLMEYQGVESFNRNILFHQGPFPNGTNNIGEFLAIVHALAYLEKYQFHLPVYTDSRTALAWLRNRKAKTKLVRNDENAALFDLIERAESWLQKHKGPFDVRKWETATWGEIPADFGRK